MLRSTISPLRNVAHNDRRLIPVCPVLQKYALSAKIDSVRHVGYATRVAAIAQRRQRPLKGERQNVRVARPTNLSEVQASLEVASFGRMVPQGINRSMGATSSEAVQSSKTGRVVGSVRTIRSRRPRRDLRKLENSSHRPVARPPAIIATRHSVPSPVTSTTETSRTSTDSDRKPLNAADRLAQAKDIICRLAQYHFANEKLLQEALDPTNLRYLEGNQRLAMIGDAVLKLVVVNSWYPTGLRKQRAQSLVEIIGCNNNLARIAIDIGLSPCVLRRSNTIENPGTITLATTVEAVLGAIYLDSGKNEGIVEKAMNGIGLTMPPHTG